MQNNFLPPHENRSMYVIKHTLRIEVVFQLDEKQENRAKPNWTVDIELHGNLCNQMPLNMENMKF